MAWVWRGNAEKVTAGVASIDFSRDGSGEGLWRPRAAFLFSGRLDATAAQTRRLLSMRRVYVMTSSSRRTAAS